MKNLINNLKFFSLTLIEYILSKYKVYLLNLFTFLALAFVAYIFNYYYKIVIETDYNVFIITISVFILLISKFFVIVLIYDFIITTKFLYKNDINNIFFSCTLNSFVASIFLYLNYWMAEIILSIVDLELLEIAQFYTLMFSFLFVLFYIPIVFKADLDLVKLEKETNIRNIETFIFFILNYILLLVHLYFYNL